MLTCIFTLFFIGCKNKTDENTPASTTSAQSEDVVVKNGRLAFKDRTAFEAIITGLSSDTISFNPTARKAAQSINLPGFTSMLEVYVASPAANMRVTIDTMPINDEILAALVTPEGILEIGEWIFKIDKSKNRVSVLHESNIDLLPELKGDIANANIYLFSTNDDILDLLEEGLTHGTSNSRVSILCGGGAGESYQQSVKYTNTIDQVSITGASAYKKFGVYFHLYTTVFVEVASQNGNIIVQHSHSYYYKTNCKNYSESGPFTFNNDLRTGNYNFLSGSSSYDCKQNIYNSTRGLHDYVIAGAKYSYKGGGIIVPDIEGH